MASKGYTRKELNAMNKSQLVQIADDLGIVTAGLLKADLCEQIYARAPGVAPPLAYDSDTEASVLSAIDKTPTDTPPPVSPTHTTPGGSKLRGPTFDFS